MIRIGCVSVMHVCDRNMADGESFIPPAQCKRGRAVDTPLNRWRREQRGIHRLVRVRVKIIRNARIKNVRKHQ